MYRARRQQRPPCSRRRQWHSIPHVTFRHEKMPPTHLGLRLLSTINERELAGIMADTGAAGTATRGLATVALLKLNFDAGRDHIAMFEPLVEEALAHLEGDGFQASDVRATVLRRHQLALPINTIQTLLGRVVKRGTLRREAGRYFFAGTLPASKDLEIERARVETRQRRLAISLQEFCATRNVPVASTEDALALILRFLEQHHVALALDRPTAQRSSFASDTDEEREPVEDRATLVTAAFLQETIETGGDLARILQEMLEGYVLQNALLLKDISTAARRFNNLRVYFDSGLLLSALGLRGSAGALAIQELFTLLRDTGASVNVFEPTLREMDRILAVYEEKLGTYAGRRSLYPTDLTRHLVTSRFSPSDIRIHRALLRKNLAGLGVNIRELPAHQAHSTLDETKLAQCLSDRPNGENEPRVVHDVNCIAGILTHRGGRTSDSLDDARAVFVTGSGRPAYNATRWYEAEGGQGVPPIVGYLLLSNLAWLKRPASASKLKIHELVALCSAALRPSRKAWNAFLKHLSALERSGKLTSDEVTAIMASGLTDRILVDESVDEDTDASTLTEVVERVKAAYREEADAQVRQARQDASRSQAETMQLRMTLDRRARGLAMLITWALAATLGVSLLAGAALSTDDTVRGTRPGVVALALAIVPLVVVGVMSGLWGFQVAGWRRRLEDRVTRLVRSWLGGTEGPAAS